MATILSLKRRIQAARNVSKTTKAMQMISVSKLKKAQNATLSTRPYVNQLTILTQNVVGRIDAGTFTHPYIENRSATSKTLLIILAPDKGLCGGLISTLTRALLEYHKNAEDTYYVAVGKKIEGYVARLSKQAIANFHFGTITPTPDIIFPIMKVVDEYYLGGRVDNVKILYTDFTTFFSQTPKILQLLPVEAFSSIEKNETVDGMGATLSYNFEPSAEEILPMLLRHEVEMLLYHCFLESFASEQASRILTMQNATSNANDIIQDLLLEYNKTRQAKITSELLDITGGALAVA